MNPDGDGAVLAALAELRAELLAEMRAMRTELAMQRHEKKARDVRLERRRSMLRQLADAVGPINWSTAKEMRRVLLEEVAPPPGMERIVAELLRDEGTPKSEGKLWNAISTGALPPLPHDGVSHGPQWMIDHLQQK